MKKEEANFNCGIYLIKTSSEKILYIGASSNLNERFKNHKKLLKNKNHNNIYLQNICDKIGYDNLIFSILKFSNENDLFIYEELFIKTLAPICNNFHNLKSNNTKLFNSNLIDINLITSLNLELNKKYYNKDFEFDFNIKSFYKKLNLYCLKNGYNLEKGNSNGNRFFVIKNKSY